MTLTGETMDAYMSLFGLNDQNAALIEQECGVSLLLKGDALLVTGDSKGAETAGTVIEKLLGMIHRREPVDRARIRYAISLAREGQADAIDEMLRSVVAITHRGRQIRCKTLGQQQYVQSIRDHDLTFAIGPAGTGKTYLAMALAVSELKNKTVERIVLTRPAVEAGERLGFLPGDLTQKVDPYLRPLYDALYEFMGVDSYQKLLERGTLEIAPLAYMRGRTLSNSFIILDEAQNTTSEQMKMFLTRLGFGSRAVITGDVTQTDLPPGKVSGLEEAVTVLKDIPAIGIVRLTGKDVVRHELVQRIVEAYDAYHRSDKGGRTDEKAERGRTAGA
ncbi:MAG: PhoH family protein [Clostridia bacterium]|nr:PhoH family protein [Clostridia bacterium]